MVFVRNRMLACTFLICCMISSLAYGQTDMESRYADILDAMVGNYYQPVVVTAFGNFTFEYTGLGSSYSRFLEDVLSQAIIKTKRIRLFARNVVANMDPSFKELYTDFFKNTGVEAVLCGKFFDDGNAVRVRLELTSLTLGELIGTAELSLPKNRTPAGVSLVPPGLSQASTLKNELTSLLASASGNLVIKATTERGEGATYKDSENLVAHIFVNQDAYIKVYHIDANGKTQLIFPNQYYANNRISGGEFVQIPGQGYPFKFELHAPFGTEFIKVVASTSQFKDIENAFSDLGAANRTMLSRGLSVLQSAADTAESLVAYSIVAR